MPPKAPNISPVTDVTFEKKVLQTKGFVLVDYWAPWCGPCKAMTPALEAAQLAYSGTLKIRKYNTDTNVTFASKHKVTALPTFVLLLDGKVVDTLVGAQSRPKFMSFLAKHLDKK